MHLKSLHFIAAPGRKNSICSWICPWRATKRTGRQGRLLMHFFKMSFVHGTTFLDAFDLARTLSTTWPTRWGSFENFSARIRYSEVLRLMRRSARPPIHWLPRRNPSRCHPAYLNRFRTWFLPTREKPKLPQQWWYIRKQKGLRPPWSVTWREKVKFCEVLMFDDWSFWNYEACWCVLPFA